ncbi:MAG TPA: hypothetical protein VEO53_05470, partial [Candidatus Binatia bacterium]|nr:hypothetical protein [Candidatus Binatia bacterium]
GRSNNSLTLSWPFPSTGFVLESTASLNPPDWQPAPETQTANSERWEVVVQLNNPQRYFRLRRQ